MNLDSSALPIRVLAFKRSITASTDGWNFNWEVHSSMLTALGAHHLVNCDKRGELSHQAIIEPELNDALFHVLFHRASLRAIEILAHQIIDSRARPQCCQHVVRLRAGKIYRDLAHKIASRHLALQTNCAASISGVAAGYDHRLRAKEIRDVLWINV